MNTEILGIIAMFVLTFIIGLFLGKYIARVYGYEKTFLDPVLILLKNYFSKYQE